MRIWAYLNMLSIDIAFGAVGGCLFFANLLQVTLLPQAYLALGLIVWLIYTVDHLRDAVHKGTLLSHPRHRFHHVHQRTLKLAVAVVVALVTALAFLVRTPVLMAGILLGLVVVGYLVIQHRLTFFKEASGAALYTAGVVIAPLSLLERPMMIQEWATLLAFFLTTWINLLICSLYDHSLDTADRQHSFATALGTYVTRRFIQLLFGLVALVLLYLFITPHSNRFAATLLSLMNITLLAVATTTSYFSVDGRHRLFADLAFLFPLFILFVDVQQWF